MIGHGALAIDLPAVALFAAAGFGLGVAYFAALRRGVHHALARHAWSSYALLALARIAAAGLFFALAVRSGLPTLLAAFAGFLTARHIAVRAARRPA